MSAAVKPLDRPPPAGAVATLRRFFRALTARRSTLTLGHPVDRAPYPARHRGLHRLMLRDDGTPRCVACMLCATACPAHCITIVAEPAPAPIEKRARRFEIDQLRCVACGLCVEACPADALRMDTGLSAPPVTGRAAAVFERDPLAALGARSTA